MQSCDLHGVSCDCFQVIVTCILLWLNVAPLYGNTFYLPSGSLGPVESLLFLVCLSFLIFIYSFFIYL